VISGVCAAGSVVRILGSLGGVVAGTACMSHSAVCRFYRELRRAGLSEKDADALTEQYAEGISISRLFGRDREREDNGSD
jgi:hypothetical protein